MEDFNYTEHYKIDAEQFDYFEKRKGATAHDERRVREYLASFVLPEVSTILDVGCGSAWVAQRYLKRNKKIFSLDISTVNPVKALQQFPSENHFGITADSYSLPFHEQTFDCVIASEIIEHLVQPDLFVSELIRVIKPGGTLLISTPYKEKLQYTLCIHCNRQTPMHAHLHSFDEKKLLSLFNGVGKRDLSFTIFGNKILIFLRTYVLLTYLPFLIWKMVDKIANLFYNIPAHIIIKYRKE